MKMPERIRRSRRKAGFSQSDLAERLKVQRSAVSNWESVNDIQPSLQNLIAIARACAVSFEWLGTGRGRMSLDDEAVVSTPAADAELVDVQDERELLALYRGLPARKQQLMIEVLKVFFGKQGRPRD